MSTASQSKGKIATAVTSTVISDAAAVLGFRNGARKREYNGHVT
jgi:hypothetical protein